MSLVEHVRITMRKDTKDRLVKFLYSFDEGLEIWLEVSGRWDRVISFLLDNVEVEK